MEDNYELEPFHASCGCKSRLAKRSVLLDVGANVGVICIGMLCKGKVAKAIAIEAEPYNFELLKRNVTLNKLESRIACVKCAASTEDGFASRQLDASNLGDHRVMTASAAMDKMQGGKTRVAGVVVPTRLLDDVVYEQNAGSMPGPRECLLWIDIQGHESFAIKGATRLLASGIPAYIEVWPHGLNRWGGGAGQFTDLAREYWSDVIHFQEDRELRLPTAELPRILEQLGDGVESYDNVLLIRR
jgi:FkbM family methyltransferase